MLKSQTFNYIVIKEIGVFKSKSFIPVNTNITSSMLVKSNEFVELEKLEDYINPVGRVATKSIYQGESFTTINTLPDVTVKRGEEIVVIATNGAVTIRGLGTALQDGRAGESIKVKRGDSKKILTGKLNESGELILGE
ncbi:MAG: flagellar basal body P-ring formation chaperone FlgA [Candidatus Kapaibacterium sp.]